MKPESGSSLHSIESRFERINRDALTPVVREALGSPGFEIDHWETAVLKSRMQSTEGMVCRIAGDGRDPADNRGDWSVILKIGRGRNRGEESRKENLRETLFYETGVAEGVPGGMRAPTCLGVTRFPDDMPWIWLEDVKGESGKEWSLPRQALTAFHLGQFQGSYLAGRPMPADPIFNRRADLYSENASCVREKLPEILKTMREHPLTERAFGGRLGTRLEMLGSQSQDLLKPLCRLPLTFCHRDFGPGNMLSKRLPDGNEETVVLDWDFCGIGQIGIETQSFVSTAVIYSGKSLKTVRDLTDTTFEHYLRGLKDAGWRGDPWAIAYAYNVLLGVQGTLHLAIHLNMLLGWGEKSQARVDNSAEVLNYLLDIAADAEKYERYVD
jgi:hypothetical protein